MTQWSIGLLVVTVVAAVVATPAPASAQADPPPQRSPDAEVVVADDVEATMADVGEVPVIVTLDEDFTPEPALSPGARADQRASTRRAVDDVLATLPPDSTHDVKRFQTVPMVALTVDAVGLAALAADPQVAAVQLDAIDAATLGSSTAVIGAPTAWADGATGDGQAVAVLDTGVDGTHPFLSGAVISEACYSTTSSTYQYTSTGTCIDGSDPPGIDEEVGPGSAPPCAVHGCDHGTHVAGIVAGGAGEPGSGVAPGASIIAVQVFSAFDATYCGGTPCALSFMSDQILGLERVYALRTTYDIAAVNLSLGGGSNTTACTGDARRAVIQNLRAAGIATVIASGNDGFLDAVNAPGCIPEAITVGATTDGDTVASFSNADDQVDLLAPGVAITSSVPGGGTEAWNGTSMATPHVAGAVAVIAQGAPAATVDAIEGAFESTGIAVLDGRNGLTAPRLRVDLALDALTPAVPPVVTSLRPKVGTTAGAQTVTVTGRAFTGATAVRFGPTAATSFTVINDTTLTAVTPASPAGLANVFVETPDGLNASAPSSWFGFQVPPSAAPTVTAVAPTIGTVDGGTTVTITGTGFLTASTVRFGPTVATFTMINDSTIVAVSPPRPVGLVNVFVTNPIGANPNQPSSWFSYRVVTGPAPTVTVVAPRAGPVAGGTTVTVTGTGFTDVHQVSFGPTPATTFTVVNSTTITAVAPSRPSGLVSVVVASRNGTTPGGPAAWFTFS